MGGLSDFFKSDSEIAQDDHNRGQANGSQAGIFEQVVHDTIGSGFASDAYNAGWDNGTSNPSSGDDDD